MTDEVRAELQRRLGALPDVEPRFIDAGDAEDDDGTRLFSALSNGARRRAAGPPRRRRHGHRRRRARHPGLDRARSASAAPLHALVTGRPDERDRRIALTEAPRFGIVGKDQTDPRRRCSSAAAPARRSSPCAATASRSCAARCAPARRSRSTVRIEHGGPNVVEIEAEALAGRAHRPSNNRAVVTIEGIREKLRVLLVSGEPHAGERTWRNLLKSDANVDLVHFTILRPPEKQDGTPINELSLIAFPTRELFQQKIKEFDLIIFDRYANQSVLPSTYFDNIVRYVREGGAVLVAAGPEFAGRLEPRRARACRRSSPATPDGAHRRGAVPGRASPHGGKRHPVTRELPGSEQTPPAWGEWLRHRRRAGPHRLGRDVGRRRPAAAGACRARTRAASRSCSPTTPGCGRAAFATAARISTSCAASPTG